MVEVPELIASRRARVGLVGLGYVSWPASIRPAPRLATDYDPHVPRTHKMRRHDLGLSGVHLSHETLKRYDCVIIITHHDAFNWQKIADNAPLIVDTRNA